MIVYGACLFYVCYSDCVGVCGNVCCVTDLCYLLVVVRQHLIGSQVLTRCPPLQNVPRVQAVAESRPTREIDDVFQITIKFTLEANNITRENTSYILGHCIEKAYCSPSKTIIGK